MKSMGFLPLEKCRKCFHKGQFCGFDTQSKFYIECANEACKLREVRFIDPKGPENISFVAEEDGENDNKNHNQ
jgi:hypothetical protein